MLDPITAIGLAGNIVQFVDFSWSLLCESKKLYDSGTGVSAENEDLEIISSDLLRLSDALTAPSSTGAMPLETMKLVSQCKEVAHELLAVLDDIREKGPRKRRKSFVAALQSRLKKEQISSLVARMERLRGQMQIHLQRMLL